MFCVYPCVYILYSHYNAQQIPKYVDFVCMPSHSIVSHFEIRKYFNFIRFIQIDVDFQGTSAMQIEILTKHTLCLYVICIDVIIRFCWCCCYLMLMYAVDGQSKQKFYTIFPRQHNYCHHSNLCESVTILAIEIDLFAFMWATLFQLKPLKTIVFHFSYFWQTNKIQNKTNQ